MTKLVTFLGFVTALFVNTTPLMANDDLAVDLCSNISGFAGDIMEIRQKGAPMAKVIEVTKPHIKAMKGIMPKFDNLAMDIIMSAYDYPLMGLEENKKTATTEFSNKHMLNCLRMMNEN